MYQREKIYGTENIVQDKKIIKSRINIYIYPDL